MLYSFLGLTDEDIDKEYNPLFTLLSQCFIDNIVCHNTRINVTLLAFNSGRNVTDTIENISLAAHLGLRV